MSTKTLIYIGIAAGGTIGGYVGARIDNGNIFGLWSILFTTIGSFAGIWTGYTLGSNL